MSILAAIGKKALLLLLGNEKGRKAIGYTVGIALFLALPPLIIFMSLLGWLLGDGGEDLRGRMGMGELNTEIAEPHEVQEGNCTDFGCTTALRCGSGVLKQEKEPESQASSGSSHSARQSRAQTQKSERSREHAE